MGTREDGACHSLVHTPGNPCEFPYFHQGETEDLGPPTGSPFERAGITIEQFSDGKIVEDWINFDALGLMQQLGLMEQPSG